MTSDLTSALPQCKWNPPPVPEVYNDFIRTFGDIPHTDYLDFMLKHDGGGGPAGRTCYLILTPLDEIAADTERSGAPIFAPGLLLFGGDGGGEAYAFDRKDPRWPIVAVPLVGLSRKELKPIASTFTEFVQKLASDEVWDAG
jgi:hypothetical protein